MKYYELGFARAPWGTNYYSHNVNSAIKEFINDSLYHIKDGVYWVRVRGYDHLFRVTKKTEINTKIKVDRE